MKEINKPKNSKQDNGFENNKIFKYLAYGLSCCSVNWKNKLILSEISQSSKNEKEDSTTISAVNE